MLQEMKFKTRIKFHYDPYHIISEKRLQARLSVYEHQEDKLLKKIIIKKHMNRLRYWKALDRHSHCPLAYLFPL